jgi:site-specific DNA-methyltransferase (adenine-specific)
MARAILEPGDCRDVLLELAAAGESFHACITDPPYHLTSIVKRFGGENAAPAQFGSDGAFARASRGFMGKTWDGGGVAFDPSTWRAVFDVLRPGAHLLAFGGTRTFHRMAVAIEDAGFEIRDTVMWLYATGFPKSHNVAKTAGAAWSGWGTALKPAWEPIIVARRPLAGTVAANVLAHGTGALNIGASRIALPDGDSLHDGLRGDYERLDTGTVDSQWGFKRVDRAPGLGRWPANVTHDGSDEVIEAFAAYAARGGAGSAQGDEPRARARRVARTDTATAARFFYSAKATIADRGGSRHPTVKPLALLRYLCRMVTPPGGRVLDPFAGSGTTLQGAVECGFDATGIERDPEYQADIRRRLAAQDADDLKAMLT